MVAAIQTKRRWRPLRHFPTMTIALDADDVLLDMVPDWLAVYNELSGDSLRFEDIDRWEMTQLVLPEWKSAFLSLRTPDIYDTIQPIEGAQAGVEHLLREGHRLVVATYDSPAHVRSKVAAIRRFFPELEHVVFAKNKRAAVRYDILIDDGAHNHPDVLFRRPWNLKAKLAAGQLPAMDWSEVITAVHMHGVIRHYGVF